MSTEVSSSAKVVPQLFQWGALIGAAILVTIPFVWWHEGPPFVVIERQLLTPKVRPGEKLRVRNIIDVSKRCDTFVRRTFVDSGDAEYDITAQRANIPASANGKTHFEFTSEVTVPRAALPGPAIYRVMLQWECNPLQELVPGTATLNDMRLEVLP